MFAFILTCVLLFPLSWAICNGPRAAFVQLFGGVIAIGWLFYKRQLLALFRLAPIFFTGFVYACTAYVSNEPRDTYPYQAALLLLFYGIPAGLCVRRLAESAKGWGVTWALMAFALGMTAIGLFILHNPEVQRITAESSGSFNRTNGDESEVIVYLHIFSISNVIIGIVPFTLFALAAFPVVLTGATLRLRLFVLAMSGIAAYANIQIATRTTLMACALSSAAVIVLALRSMRLRKFVGFVAMMLGMVAGALVYVGRESDRLSYLMERFSQMGSDSRLGIWTEAIKILQRTPDGHGIRQLQSHYWAHNLFLDVGLTDGWVAILAMLAMYIFAVYFTWRALRRPGFFELPSNVLMLSWLIATFVSSMILPPQAAFLSTLHLALGYFAPMRSGAPAPEQQWVPVQFEQQQFAN